MIRRRPVSELTSPTVVEPCPCHDPTVRVTATIGWVSDGVERHPNPNRKSTKNTNSTKTESHQRFAAPPFGRRTCPIVMTPKCVFNNHNLQTEDSFSRHQDRAA